MKEFDVVLSTRSKKYLKKLKDKKLKKILLDKLEELKLNPEIGIFMQGNMKAYRKIIINYRRAKDYRIVYEIVEDEVLVYVLDLGTKEGICYA